MIILSVDSLFFQFDCYCSRYYSYQSCSYSSFSSQFDPITLIPITLIPINLIPITLIPINLVPINLVPITLVPFSVLLHGRRGSYDLVLRKIIILRKIKASEILKRIENRGYGHNEPNDLSAVKLKSICAHNLNWLQRRDKIILDNCVLSCLHFIDMIYNMNAIIMSTLYL